MKMTKLYAAGSVFILIYAFNLTAIEPVQFSVMSTIEAGTPPDGLGYLSKDGMGNNPEMPRAFSINPWGMNAFFVYDFWSAQLVEIHSDGQMSVIENDHMSAATHFAYSSSNSLLLSQNGNYAVYSSHVEKVIHGNIVDEFPVNQNVYYTNKIVMIDKMIFINDRTRSNQLQYHSFEIVDDFESPMVYRTPEETIEYIQNEYDGDEDLRFDDDGYLFWGDRLVAPHGRAFVKYHWDETIKISSCDDQ